jgi:hypothetical protein
MAKLTYKQRKKLPKSVFVFKRKRKYPIPDRAHARNALARVSAFGTRKEKKAVCRAVMRKFPDVHARSCRLDHKIMSM